MQSERIQRQIDRLLDQADQAIANRDWTAVVEHAQSVLRLNSDNSDALAYLAAAKRDSGKSTALNVTAQPAPAARHAESVDNSRARLEQSIPKELLAKLDGARRSGTVSGECRALAKPDQAKEDEKAARTRLQWKN